MEIDRSRKTPKRLGVGPRLTNRRSPGQDPSHARTTLTLSKLVQKTPPRFADNSALFPHNHGRNPDPVIEHWRRLLGPIREPPPQNAWNIPLRKKALKWIEDFTGTRLFRITKIRDMPSTQTLCYEYFGTKVGGGEGG
jgi:hypothetical protein